jgi:predicted secreted protein
MSLAHSLRAAASAACYVARYAARYVAPAAVSVAWCLAASAQVLPPPQNVISLNATATMEVPKDWLTVVLSTTREGVDAAAVQAQLRQALDAALAEARKLAQPGQVEVQTGAFSLFPRVQPPSAKQAAAAQSGSIAGWQGSTELVVEGRDMGAIAQLVGRIPSLSIARVSSGLSREARQQVEADVTTLAIERFRARAQTVSRQFGFGAYTVRELQIGSDAPMPAAAPMAFARAGLRGAEDAGLPVEVGKAAVTVSVGGSVQMK